MPRRRKVPDPEDIALAVLDACAARVAATTLTYIYMYKIDSNYLLACRRTCRGCSQAAWTISFIRSGLKSRIF